MMRKMGDGILLVGAIICQVGMAAAIIIAPKSTLPLLQCLVSTTGKSYRICRMALPFRHVQKIEKIVITGALGIMPAGHHNGDLLGALRSSTYDFTRFTIQSLGPNRTFGDADPVRNAPSALRAYSWGCPSCLGRPFLLRNAANTASSLIR
jgi:hypothetical protein